MDYSPVWISARTAAISTLFCFFLGTAAAHGVCRLKSGRVKAVLDGILTMPMVLPPTIAGFFLLLLFGQKRPVGRFLASFGIRIVFNWQATVLAALVISFPLMYRSARGAFEQVDETLIFAGRTLGMSEGEIFRRIILPEALPGVLSGGILAFARGLGEFGATAMIAGNIAGKSRTLPLAVYSAVAGGNMEEAFGYVVILVIISFLAVLGMHGLAGRRDTKKK